MTEDSIGPAGERALQRGLCGGVVAGVVGLVAEGLPDGDHAVQRAAHAFDDRDQAPALDGAGQRDDAVLDRHVHGVRREPQRLEEDVVGDLVANGGVLAEEPGADRLIAQRVRVTGSARERDGGGRRP